MRKLNFGFFDDSGQPRESRILMFYSFETDERLARSGILHYHLGERRFVGPAPRPELTDGRARVPRDERPARASRRAQSEPRWPPRRPRAAARAAERVIAFFVWRDACEPHRRRRASMSTAAKGREIAPASGKLGVLLPGMGAVATTFIAGVEAIRTRPREADRQPDPDGHGPARQAHRQPLAAHQGLRAARRARGPRVRRLGHLPRQRLRGRQEGGRARDTSTSSRSRPFLETIKPWPAVFDPQYVKKLHGAEREEGQEQARPGRAGLGRHRALQEGERPRRAW